MKIPRQQQSPCPGWSYRALRVLAVARGRYARFDDRTRELHILLALFTEGDNLTRSVLRYAGISLTDLAAVLPGRRGRTETRVSYRDRPLTGRCLHVLELAVEEAKSVGSPVTSGHLLLALLRCGGPVTRVMTQLGLEYRTAAQRLGPRAV